MQMKFEGEIFSWVQFTHENITQQINITTKLSGTNLSLTTVLHGFYKMAAIIHTVSTQEDATAQIKQ